MQPDTMFYAVLIEVVGAAGDLETAFKIFAKAEALIPQRQVGHIRCILRATFPVRDCFHTLQCLHRCVTPSPSHQQLGPTAFFLLSLLADAANCLVMP